MRVTEASSWHNERERTEKEQARGQLWKRQAGGDGGGEGGVSGYDL